MRMHILNKYYSSWNQTTGAWNVHKKVYTDEDHHRLEAKTLLQNTAHKLGSMIFVLQSN